MSARNSVKLMLVFLYLFMVSSFSLADINDGAVAIQNGQFEKAYSEWKPLADKGETIAQAAIGVMYHAGQGIHQDYVEAIRWYRLAAEKGNAQSQANLGVMYAKGVGVERNLVQTYAWYDLAAMLGEARHSRSRDLIAQQMSKSQLTQAKDLSQSYAVKYVLPFRSAPSKP